MFASIYADVIGSHSLPDPDVLLPTLGEAAHHLNQTFAPAIAEPFVVDFGDELRGALTDPTQVPLCVSVMRETLAPLLVRVGVGIGVPAEDAFTEAKNEDRLIHYAGTGGAGDMLLNAFCRLLDPYVRRRTPKQWEAIGAVRELGGAKLAAERLGITRQSLVERLRAGEWRLVEDADSTIAAYLSEVAGGDV